MHMQVNSPMRSKQVASFWQGMERHSLMSISQRGPAYPRPHWHWKEPSVFTHFPKCSQGFAPVIRRQMISNLIYLVQSQIETLKHKKLGGTLPMEHSSISWLQAPPTKPAGQVQIARPLRGLVSHTAPSLQGLLTHASSRWQSRPVKQTRTTFSLI